MATAYIVGKRNDLSQGMSKANNVEYGFDLNNFLFNRKPDYLVHIFNVSKETFKVSRPPMIREMIVPGIEEKDGDVFEVGHTKVSRVTSFPQPLLIQKANVESSDIVDIIPQDVRRFAMDIINPDNLTLDQDAVINPQFVFSQGNNLGARGVFWSLNEIPTEKEVERAVARMEAFYTYLLNQAREIETSNPGELRQVLTPSHHAACEYWGEETSWHGKKSKPMDCPVCGSRVKAGIAYHIDAANELCIIDWARTVKAGKRTRQQAYEATGDAQFAPLPVAAQPAVQAEQHKPVKTQANHIPTENK